MRYLAKDAIVTIKHRSAITGELVECWIAAGVGKQTSLTGGPSSCIVSGSRVWGKQLQGPQKRREKHGSQRNAEVLTIKVSWARRVRVDRFRGTGDNGRRMLVSHVAVKRKSE